MSPSVVAYLIAGNALRFAVADACYLVLSCPCALPIMSIREVAFAADVAAYCIWGKAAGLRGGCVSEGVASTTL